MSDPVATNAPGTVTSILMARCPRCGGAPLFSGFLTIAPRCTACGLDFSIFDVGDGATVFVILIAGFLVCGGALFVEVAYSPPYWVHALIWLPTIATVVLGGLRLVKAALMVLQYKHQAREGRLVE
ncbi:MAG TPA: DUF983 domain-containing protein [Rhizomicrobium sp.]|jgi:uncharacterized protein (DUF983 family)|nr:DUF983 domain-containing protein [Rhizomicrobium sp.]